MVTSCILLLPGKRVPCIFKRWETHKQEALTSFAARINAGEANQADDFGDQPVHYGGSAGIASRGGGGRN